MARLPARIRYADIMSTLAVFLALGGIGYAAITIPKNSVGTKQLKKNAVTSKKVKNGALLTKDFKKGQLPAGATGPQGPVGPTGATGATGPATGAAGGDLTGNYPNPEIAANAVGGNEVDEASLSGVNAATLGGTSLSGLAGIGRQASTTSCNDDGHATPPQGCGSVTLTLPRSQRLLLLGSGYSFVVNLNDPMGPDSGTDDPSKVEGFCAVYVDGAVPAGSGRSQNLLAGAGESGIGWAFTWITEPLAAGPHELVMRCDEVDGDIDFVATLSAVALAAD